MPADITFYAEDVIRVFNDLLSVGEQDEIYLSITGGPDNDLLCECKCRQGWKRFRSHALQEYQRCGAGGCAR